VWLPRRNVVICLIAAQPRAYVATIGTQKSLFLFSAKKQSKTLLRTLLVKKAMKNKLSLFAV
jgi:hypothetical protein